MNRLVMAAALIAISCASVPQSNTPGQTVATFTPPPPTTSRPSPAPTSAPPAVAVPTPRTAYKIGETVRFDDGWRVTVTKFEEQPASGYFTPAPGMRYVAVILKFENGSTKPISPNAFYFKLQDSIGVRRGYAIFGGERNDALTSSELAPGAFVVGSLVFEAPVGDTRLQLIYEQFGYRQTTFELF